MGVIKKEKRESYAALIRERYRIEGLPTAVADIQKATRNKRQAIFRVLTNMAKDGEILLFFGRTMLCFPPDVVLPAIAIQAALQSAKKPSAMLRGVPDELVLRRLIETFGEFYRRGLTMNQLSEYAHRTGL